ncbi:NRDE family protein [Thalassomonas haliotis]|uniref:NRDE family protein n=1 Tax=Thalassomonas haliotis TaxID=485448 RepID=A0ABY7VAY9_9GAMM|nr:NRDE family protein [Thalassomonas haliotis]WDE10738.1 NRDE family protein [Thalassomonas haliotis]
MCILFFALKQHPNYPVIICANRDEFHQRPTRQMFRWQQPDILAGQDLQAGGSWLGLTANGDFSALTNYRQGQTGGKSKGDEQKSRGNLVLTALTELEKSKRTATKPPNISAGQQSDNTDFFSSLSKQAQDYQGFNLIYGPLNNLHCYDSINNKYHQLTPGFHSICNGALDDIWPKMALGQSALTKAIREDQGQNRAELVEQLFQLMTNSQEADSHELPDTGMPPAIEQMLSAIFIVSSQYGTRSTTIITQDNQGEILINDRSYTPQGESSEQQVFNLSQVFASS